MKLNPRISMLLPILFIFECAFTASDAFAQTILVSQSSAANPGNSSSTNADISSDGRFLVFSSESTNLTENDTNGVSDIFRHEQTHLRPNNNDPDGTRETLLISGGLSGSPADGASRSPRISDDGRWIVFSSTATNLVSGDTNGKEDIFLYDANDQSIRRVSVGIDIYGSVTGESNGDSVTPSISSDGCLIAYATDATNLSAQGNDGQPLTDSNGKRDIVLTPNTALGSCSHSQAYNELVSISASGAQSDGDSSLPVVASTAFIAFSSSATNLVADDTNGVADVFVRDRRVSIGDGRTTLLVSRSTSGAPGNGASYSIDMDSGGDLTFDSDASNIVVDDTNNKRDVFRRSITNGRTLGESSLVSSTVAGVQGNGDSSSPSISAGGLYIAFVSEARNLADRTDCNNASDILVRDYTLSTLRRRNLSTSGYQADRGKESLNPVISSDGFLVAYQSTSDFIPSDENETFDIYTSVASEDPQARDNPLTSAERLDEPPDVCVSGKTANVFMEYFSEVASSSQQVSATATRCPRSGICYTADLTRTGTGRSTDNIRKIAGRNRVAFRDLEPGTYRVSFRASGRDGSSSITTNRSPKRRINVRR